MPSGHLTVQEREVIGQMRYAGHRLAVIAERLGRSRSTISREMSRSRAANGMDSTLQVRHSGQPTIDAPEKQPARLPRVLEPRVAGGHSVSGLLTSPTTDSSKIQFN